MQEFEDATVGQQAPALPTEPRPQTFEITTDDLVFMIGEKAIGERQSNKMIAMLQNNLAYLQQEWMKLQSVGAASTGELDAMRQRAEAAEQRANAADTARTAAEQATVSQGASWQGRIAALEDQVYQTALQRDEAIQAREAISRDREAQANVVARLNTQRDEAIRERDAIAKERDAAIQTNAAFQERLNRSVGEIDTMRIELADLKDKAIQLASIAQERDALRAELDSLKAAPAPALAPAPGDWEEATPIPEKPAKRTKK